MNPSCVNQNSSAPIHSLLKVSLGLFLIAVAIGLNFNQPIQAAEKAKVLMVTQSAGFVHGSVKRKDNELAACEIAMTQLGQKTGLFEVHCTQDAESDFTAENLKNYDIVMFYTTGKLPISEEARKYFAETWLKEKGHGFIGFHSAADTYGEDNDECHWYQEIVGGTFNGHPWNANNTVTISVHDQSHPAMKPFDKEFEFTDEIYQYKNWVPENVHVLMSLNMAKCNPSMPYHVPVAWAREWGDGKIYFNNLGHNEKTWTNPVFLKSTEGAIRWVMNLESADVKPNPEVSAQQEAKGKKDAEKKKKAA